MTIKYLTLILSGIEYYPDGAVFSGEFKLGKKVKGKLEITSERKYIGEFNNDKIEGKGTFFFTDKKYCQGTWENNELNGLAIYFRDDKVHKGNFIKLKKFIRILSE
jgi:hypothetical protein